MMAIILSYQANKIAQRQAKLAELQNQPFVHIKLQLEKNRGTSTASHDTLVISNVGAPLYDLSAEVGTLLRISRGRSENNLSHFTTALRGYYTNTYLANQPTGLLAVVKSPENRLKLTQLMHKLKKQYSQDVPNMSWELKRCIRIVYYDRLGNRQEEYFLADDISSKKIKADYGMKLFKLYSEGLQRKLLLDLSTMQPEDLLDRIKANTNIRPDTPVSPRPLP